MLNLPQNTSTGILFIYLFTFDRLFILFKHYFIRFSFKQPISFDAIKHLINKLL